MGEAGGAASLTGAQKPKKRISLGLHPVSFGKAKEMGWSFQRRSFAAPQSPVLPMSLRAMPPVDQFSIRPRCHSVRDVSVKTRPNCGASPGNVAQMMMGASGVRASVSYITFVI